jgi:hypothetical protein
MKKWQEIEQFLKLIHQDHIENQKYYMFGYQEEYKKMEVVNLGYIPFYDGKETIRDIDILPDLYKKNRPSILKNAQNIFAFMILQAGLRQLMVKHINVG